MKKILVSILSAIQLLSANTSRLPQTNEINTYELKPEHNGDIYNIPALGDGDIEYVELHSDIDGTLTATIELIYTVY